MRDEDPEEQFAAHEKRLNEMLFLMRETQDPSVQAEHITEGYAILESYRQRPAGWVEGQTKPALRIVE